jgi:hypothetical protein
MAIGPARACLRLLLLPAAALLAAGPLPAAESASEQAVRAALVYNFLKFTEWPPASAGERLRLCIASTDPEQLAAMEALGDRRVRDQQVTTVRLPGSGPVDCDAIYVDSRQRWQAVAERHAGRRPLAIGGYPGFSAEGGMIEIVLEDGIARFDVNLAEARRAGLRLYPQLLRLARRVAE